MASDSVDDTSLDGAACADSGCMHPIDHNNALAKNRYRGFYNGANWAFRQRDAEVRDLQIEIDGGRSKLRRVIEGLNKAIPLIRKWTNINSSMGPDLQEAGNALSYILAQLPEEQTAYLERSTNRDSVTITRSEFKAAAELAIDRMMSDKSHKSVYQHLVLILFGEEND